ncbi:MarR family winged helix-turn-helix transcriptional regulator [Salsipaludibacter albus]|uniref:MarR family winged helix-turn-helix transcriptional regulator n=1 Tax=Salsipaludibacter albus TaxID=2849650 RepID=UPI001EE3EA9D
MSERTPSAEAGDQGPEPALAFDPIAVARDHWVAHGWALPDVMTAVTSIARVHQLVLRRCDEALAPHDLTFARYEVLALLTFSRRGALPLGKVGERLQVSPASVTNAIDRLEGSGYVERRPHPTDGRAVLAAITRSGRRTVAAATEALEAVRYGVEGLDDDAARRVFATLRAVRASAGDFPTDA